MTLKETKNTYDKFGKVYHKKRHNPKENFYNEYLEMPAISSLLKNIVKKKKVLDLGCGSGIFSKKLRSWGAKVTGIDLSKTLINIAQKENPEINFFVGNAEKTKFKNKEFDIVVSGLMLHYLKNLKKSFLEVSRILKNDGLFVFSMNHPVREAVE